MTKRKNREPEVLRTEQVVTANGVVFTVTIYKPSDPQDVFARLTGIDDA